MVFYWSLSDSKSPQVSRTLLSILAVLNNVVIWIVSPRPVISKSSCLCINPLITVLRAPITIGINVTFMFQRVFFQFPTKVEVFILLFYYLHFFFTYLNSFLSLSRLSVLLFILPLSHIFSYYYFLFCFFFIFLPNLFLIIVIPFFLSFSSPFLFKCSFSSNYSVFFQPSLPFSPPNLCFFFPVFFPSPCFVFFIIFPWIIFKCYFFLIRFLLCDFLCFCGFFLFTLLFHFLYFFLFLSSPSSPHPTLLTHITERSFVKWLHYANFIEQTWV